MRVIFKKYQSQRKYRYLSQIRDWRIFWSNVRHPTWDFLGAPLIKAPCLKIYILKQNKKLIFCIRDYQAFYVKGQMVNILQIVDHMISAITSQPCDYNTKTTINNMQTIFFYLLTMPKPLNMWITTNCVKFLEMGIPDYLTCLLRNMYADQEATVTTRHGTTDWFQIGKGVCQGCILSPCLFKLYAQYSMRNARLDEAQAGVKIAGRNINNFRYTDDTTLMAESEGELKGPLMKVKEENEKVGLKLTIQKTKIMASEPITSCK